LSKLNNHPHCFLRRCTLCVKWLTAAFQSTIDLLSLLVASKTKELDPRGSSAFAVHTQLLGMVLSSHYCVQYHLDDLCSSAGLVHPQFRCHGCLVEGIAGMLWKCVKCFEYHLCTPCYAAGKHSIEHSFHRIDIEKLTERLEDK